MHPNEMLVRRFYEARARDDREAIRACLHPEVAWHDPYPEPHGGDLRGVDAVFAQIFDAAGELTGGSGRLIPHDVLANDQHAVALVDWSTSLHGRSMQGREVAVFHVDSGLITEAWFYSEDPQAVAEFFG
jgi:ketosteroid isomerase-like protein